MAEGVEIEAELRIFTRCDRTESLLSVVRSGANTYGIYSIPFDWRDVIFYVK
jgi:hypothetical protein